MEEFMNIKGSGLKFEISCIEETIRLRGELGKDTAFEEGILKAYKKELRHRQETVYSGVADPNLGDLKG